MGINIELVKIKNINSVVDDILTILQEQNKELLISIMTELGYLEREADNYYVLNNEYYEDTNAYYNLSRIILCVFKKVDYEEEALTEEYENIIDDIFITLLHNVEYKDYHCPYELVDNYLKGELNV